MNLSRTRLIGALAATSLLAGAAVPVVADAGSNDNRNGGSLISNLLGALGLGGGGGGGGSSALQAVGLTADNRLVGFETNRPERARSLGTISGLSGGDTKLIGIDYRPANGALYGVGDKGGVYTLQGSQATGRVQLVTGTTPAPVVLSGASFGVDFNPAADRLRIISDTGQSLRADVTTGTTTPDGGLTYPPATAPATGVTGAGYTNNDNDATTTATTLFDIDTTLDQVAIQSPANSGQLAATGKLGVDAGADSGFDVYSEVRNGTTVKQQAGAALTVGGTSRFYGIDLLTGKATDQGAFRSGDKITGLAFPLQQK